MTLRDDPKCFLETYFLSLSGGTGHFDFWLRLDDGVWGACRLLPWSIAVRLLDELRLNVCLYKGTLVQGYIGTHSQICFKVKEPCGPGRLASCLSMQPHSGSRFSLFLIWMKIRKD